MRLFLYLFLSMLCFAVQAQTLQDDFSDGNFTVNPLWTGDATDFIINAGFQLQSDNLGVSASSALSTAATIKDSTFWAFYVQMDFTPSTSNYTLVYLQSDNAVLDNTSNGYYLRIGSSGSSDSIEIYRLDSGASTKIFGGTAGAVANNPTTSIRIIRSNAGQWEVFADYSGGSSYASEGVFSDTTYTNGTHFGFKASYTSTRGDKFFFDDIYVSPLVVDVVAPTIDSVSALNATAIDVYFDEEVESSTANNSANYSLDNGVSVLSATRDALDFKLVHLSLSSMQSSSSYNLTINAVEDLNGNALVNANVTFTYYNIQAVTFQDLLINEVFADPSPVVGLPAFEYVELFNRSAAVIDLGGLLFNDGSDKLLPSFLLQPDSVVLLTAVANLAAFSSYGSVVGLSSMSITNGGEALSLKDAANNTIDSIVFDLTWYQDVSKELGGWSLELTNPNLICQGKANWSASSDPSGGTPAQQNAVYDNSPDTQAPSLISANFVSASSISLLFDEQLDATTANNSIHYTIPGLSVFNAIFTPPNQVLLTVSPMIDQTLYNLSVATVSDCSANPIGLNNTASFVFYAIQPAAFQDIIINEILADPSPTVNLPNAEFVELHNRSNKTIDLDGMVFNDGTDHVLASYLLFPDSFVILTATANVGSYAVYGNTLSVGSMALTNGGELLQLKDMNGLMVDSVQFDDAWYADAVKDDGGWSLELINPNTLCQVADNWDASSSNNGGTPGLQNSVFSNSQDLQGPLLISANFIDSNRVQLSFNETLGANATNLSNYTISATTLSNVTVLGPKLLVLDLATNMLDQTTYVVSINSLTDCAGNSILASIQDSFIYYEVQAAVLHDLIFTEIMPDPVPVVGLPAAEYIELHNRSNKTIDLSSYTLFESTNHTLPAQIMLPGSYVLLCAAADASLFGSLGTVVPVNSMGLTNSGELLMLYNNLGMLIDSVDYNLTWYQDNSKDDGGYSLSLINPNQRCKGRRNWTASIALAGGTPAAQNLVYDDQIDSLPPFVTEARQYGPNQIYLQFDDVLNKSLAGNSNNYSIDNGAIIITVVCLSDTEILLTLGANMVDQTNYTISLMNLEDCIGNSTGSINTNMTYYEAGAATHYDIIINEIMADPNPVVGLPEKEYIELYNRSNKTFNLEGFTFTDASSVTATLPFFIFHPGAYITIYSAADTIGFAAFGYVGPTNAFPDLNTSDELILKDQSGEVIDAVSYELFWYQNADKDDGGWSLERINPNRPCEGASNWRASENLLGGSPSQQNSIFDTEADNQSPDALRAFPLGSDSIRIYFSEALDEVNASQLSNYSIDDPSISIVAVRLEQPFYNSIILFLDTSLVLGQTYIIRMNAGLSDCVGNPIALKNTVRVALAEDIQVGDLILNEVLFNPVTNNKDFVELYNRSSKVLNSADLVVSNAQIVDGNLANASSLQTSPVVVDWLIFPQEYVVITEDADLVKQQYFTPNPENFIENDLPTFDDKEGNILLYAAYDSSYIDNFGQLQVLYMVKVLDLFDYQDDFHSPLIDDQNGVSLERIDFDAPCNDPNNWHSAATNVDYATPSYQNSTFLVNDIIGKDLIELPIETVSPDGDGYEDFLLINYHVNDLGYVANIDVYDASGRLIRHLVKGELLSREGALQWDGTDNNGRKAAVGIHILFIEIFNPQGDVRRFKKTCIVAGKMN